MPRKQRERSPSADSRPKIVSSENHSEIVCYGNAESPEPAGQAGRRLFMLLVRQAA